MGRRPLDDRRVVTDLSKGRCSGRITLSAACGFALEGRGIEGK